MITRRYFPTIFERAVLGQKPAYVRGVTMTENGVAVRTFDRPDYTPVQVAELCDWLNEREQGYSQPAMLPLEWLDDQLFSTAVMKPRP